MPWPDGPLDYFDDDSLYGDYLNDDDLIDDILDDEGDYDDPIDDNEILDADDADFDEETVEETEE